MIYGMAAQMPQINILQMSSLKGTKTNNKDCFKIF